ncbi:hypothetical protein PRUPE_3G307900 [Prunus persica]|uniref:Uncharacterized protein n=1 Tax=Prunus persica TaxID=3760 RepID=A0A251Q7Z9_PRUPE|nr:hypothetical protein PRUPE_3G307900 [Prunus persica]
MLDFSFDLCLCILLFIYTCLYVFFIIILKQITKIKVQPHTSLSIFTNNNIILFNDENLNAPFFFSHLV